MNNNFVRRNLKKRSRDRPVERKKRRDDDEPNFKRQAKAKASSNVTEDSLQAGMSWVTKNTQSNQVAVFRDTTLAEFNHTLSRSSNVPRGLAAPISSLVSIQPEGYDFRKCEGEARSLAESAAPKCFGHQMPSKIMTVAKAGNNRGRKFYCCTFPYEERCDFFMWVEDNPSLLQYYQIATATSQPISFLDAVTNAYRKKLLEMTKEELTFEVFKFNSRKLITATDDLMKPVVKSSGTKVEVIMRLEEAARWWIALHYRDFHTHTSQASDEMEVDDDEEKESEAKDDDDSDEGEDDDGMISLSDSSDDEDRHPPPLQPARTISATASISTGSNSSHHMHRIDNIIQQVFGFTSLRSAQRHVIERVLTHQPTLAIMPTGYGKSLCYLLPGLLTQRGLVIVISPLIALMTDQLAKVPPELPSATLTNTLTTQACGILCNELLSGALRLLFVSPERFCSTPFHRLLKQFRSLGGIVQLVCVDEAHCLSHWSFNFRPAFLRIGRILKTIVQPQSILALTATAGLKVREDIMTTLGIEPMSGGLMMNMQPRTNLKLRAELCEDEHDRFTRIYDLLKHIQTSPKATGGRNKGLTIIYVWRRHDAESLEQLLTAKDIEVAFYHGGMDSNQRENVQKRFEKGKLKVIVATVAFGMGVDNQLVQRVIHYNLPKSIESYVQETGRAGRNGDDAVGLLLFGKQDAIEQHSLGHSGVLSELQILAFLYVLITNHRQQQQAQNNNTSSSSVEYELMEKVLDLDEAKTDTILSLLEREGLVTINGTHHDCIEIRWRLSQEKIQLIAEKDEFMKKLVQASTTIVQQDVNDENAVHEDDELDLRTKRNQPAVKVSVLQLSVMTSTTIEQVIRNLYSYQHRGLFILKASLPCASVTLFPDMWLAFADSAPSTSSSAIVVNTLLLQVPAVARKLSKQMNDHVQCNAKRVECMWQVAMTLEKIEQDRPGMTSNEVIQQFLAHEMEANGEDSSSREGDSSLDNGDDLAVLLATKAVVPSLHCNLLPDANDSNVNNSSSNSSAQRLKVDAMTAIRVISREPELVRLVDNMVGLTIRKLTSLPPEQRKALVVGVSAAKAACLALYAVKVLHGLPSSLLIASYWSTGLFAEEWGKYREIAFEELLSIAMSVIVKFRL